MIILALDALDNKLVEKFNCKNLMQLEHGKTNISSFNLARTIVLWASFSTGKNMESKIPIEGQWEFELKKEETFFKFFKTAKIIDLPAFSFKQKAHEAERKLLKGFFENSNSVEEYNEWIWKKHEENKREFFNSLGKFDLLLGYFNLADAIGHLNFGDEKIMRKVYDELDGIAEKVKAEDWILIISDHGMQATGRFGDHTKNGFYSSNKKLNLKEPNITDFFKLIINNIKK